MLLPEPTPPPAPGWQPVSPDEARKLVSAAARLYFATRRERVDDFIDRHFSLAGSARLHRHAIGLDILRAPANIALAGPNIALKLAGWAVGRAGAAELGRKIGARNLLLETAVGREVAWLLTTDLLELPCIQPHRRAERDALGETVLASPQVQERLGDALAAIGAHAGDEAFRRRLEREMATYTGTRAAAADISTALITLGAGALAVQQATPGMLSLGPSLAALLAHQAAVASFPLGATAGGLWYAAFPVAVSPALVVGLTGGLVAMASVVAAFVGILADPVQRRLGLHRRRLLHLIDVLEKQICDDSAEGQTVRDHYVARLLDICDMIGAAYRLARG